MDPFTPRVKEALDTFVARVREDLPVVAVYVFGSGARGEAREGSDVDVAVVSPRFRSMRRVDAIALLLDKTRGIGVDLQPVGLTPEDLADDDDVVAQAIAADGVEVGAARPEHDGARRWGRWTVGRAMCAPSPAPKPAAKEAVANVVSMETGDLSGWSPHS